MAPVFEGGRIDVPLQKVIDAVGLRRALNMAPFRGVKDYNDVWPFQLQQRRAGKLQSAGRYIEPQRKEQVADRFVRTVNQWLKLVANRQLTIGGRRLVLKVMGEALDNAERHSKRGSDDGDWAVAGFLSRTETPPSVQYRCPLALLSIGETISETVVTSPPATLSQMDEYVRRHGMLPAEGMRTVFALQDGVTKDHRAAAEGRGGTGFQDILEFFADLAGSSAPYARLAIVSGATCVAAFGPFIKGIRKGDEYSERELWFNEPNDPTYPPEAGHVFTLPCRLNGTLITMVIDLDQAYLEGTSDARDRS